MLHYIPGLITVEFAGRILELLDEEELLDLLGHEIAHYKLYQDEGGRHHTAVRLIHWICRRDSCPILWRETARRLSLYTEVYCDIAGYLVTGNRDASIRGLAKTVADFKDADAKEYLKQAEAILAQEKFGSKGLSHPELYIRGDRQSGSARCQGLRNLACAANRRAARYRGFGYLRSGDSTEPNTVSDRLLCAIRGKPNRL